MQILINQGLQTNDNETIQIGALNLIEPEILQKRKGVAQKNATPLQIGETNAINLELFLAPDYYQATMERYEEIKLNDEIFAFFSPLKKVA